MLLLYLPIVMSVKSLENVNGQEALLMSQQDEGEEAFMNAVSFPASVLRGGASTGKKLLQLPYYFSLGVIFVTYRSLSDQRLISLWITNNTRAQYFFFRFSFR